MSEYLYSYDSETKELKITEYTNNEVPMCYEATSYVGYDEVYVNMWVDKLEMWSDKKDENLFYEKLKEFYAKPKEDIYVY